MVWKPTKKQVVGVLGGLGIGVVGYGLGTQSDCSGEETDSQPAVVDGRTVSPGFANPEHLAIGFEDLDGILAGEGAENATYETVLRDRYFVENPVENQADGNIPVFYAIRRGDDGTLDLQRIRGVTIEYAQPGQPGNTQNTP